MPRTANPDTNNPSAATPAAPQQGAQAPQGGKLKSVADNFPVVHALIKGGIKGVYAPADLQPSDELALQTNPVLIKHLGLGVYRPKDPDVKAVLFNPAKISLQELQKADKDDKLTKILKPITKFLGGASASASRGQGAAGGPEPIGDGPAGGLTGQNTPAAGTAPAPSPSPVSVMPKPTFGADAQKMAAEMRSKNFAPQGPTAGPLPGGGNILNGLLKRAQ